jgi:hypothetical protein
MTAYNDEDENLMGWRRSTDLDPKALEAAHTALGTAGTAEAVVRAYLAALPPSPAVVPEGWKLVPVDDETREFANSALPVGMIHAGMDVLEKVNEDNVYYTAGDTIDWDNGMVAVAVYRAMLSASPSPPALDGAGRDGIIEECIGALEDAWTQDMSYPEAVQAISALKETP